MKKLMGILLILLVGSMMFIGCSKDTAQEVYFLNFKPEIAEVYETKVAPAFEKENPGYKLKVVTAASGTYEQTLKSEQAKSNPPVIFQTNGPVGLASSKNEAASLEGTDFYKLLADKSMALKLDGVVSAIPYAVEGYGIIYNDAIMRKYFELPNKAVAISSADEINNFATLKAVVEDMQKNKDALGIKGVFASTSMSAGNQWRWQTHTVNVPLFYEYSEKDPSASPLMTGLNSSTFDFKYNENFKNLMDLYTNNSVTEKTLLGSKSVDDSMAEFALGQCAMVQNGNWAAAQILGTAGNKVAKEDIKFLPLYMGIPGEESAGLCVGTENYLCINKNASPEAQKGADVFLTWLFSSSTGKQLVSNDLMFITPFNSFSASELPSDPLSQQVSLWMNKSGISSVAWTFNAIPSEEWKNAFGSALLSYFEGKTSWNDVVKTAQEQWTSEWNIKNK
ncbi:MAG: ABC transporter substrate-binding protein [Candidatus Treponema excrementipullorum]|nr:ABC transporter substrate-binding protein [Spirochaetia bacterium]MDD7012491.1 ABC transporter substrate-binding protein [Candidatus Treponema excrementipullorum]MDY4466501.1 ABC transporter substrate-binding protein [Candidatus Treponema excrementipullorum]MDY4708848.1 ABC transporter substrate-binding protein [Candidatus Treponema excrementipullorum]